MADNDAKRPRATLLLTRPRAVSERFADDVARRGLPLDVVIAPLMEIVPTDTLPDLPDGSDVIFTSATAVALAGRGAGRRAWCVGARTAAAARQAGFDAKLAGACADELIARLLELRPGTPMVHLRGRHQRGDVARRLGDAGIPVTSRLLYDQAPVPPDARFAGALARAPVVIPLFSPRSAELFAAAAGPGWQPGADTVFVALSPAVRSALPPDWTAYAEVADRPDAPAMLDAIARRILP